MTKLTFTETASGVYTAYVGSFTESTTITVQVKRTEAGTFRILANLSDMDPVEIARESRASSFIEQIDVPAGVSITLESESRVTLGGYE